jgi:hypothetical protein
MPGLELRDVDVPGVVAEGRRGGAASLVRWAGVGPRWSFGFPDHWDLEMGRLLLLLWFVSLVVLLHLVMPVWVVVGMVLAHLTEP